MMNSDDASKRPDFWRNIPLEAMNKAEWEALCDGCGKCCVVKLEDADTGKVSYTDIACRLFDGATCRCMDYSLRKQLVSGCLILTPETLDYAKDWMPQSCAYRRLAEGKSLPEWHPLLTGDPESVHKAGASLKGQTIPEYEVDEDDWPDHVIEEDR